MFREGEKPLDIEMFEGDFGEILTINIIEGEILEDDILRFIIRNSSHEEIINKAVNVIENSFEFSLTKEDTNLLTCGNYYWGLKQYRDNILVDTLTANNKFKVVRG